MELRVTCAGQDSGGPACSLGEIVTYWASPVQLGFDPDKLEFGLLGIGEVALRTLRIWNPSFAPIAVTVRPGPPGSFFSWQAHRRQRSLPRPGWTYTSSSRRSAPASPMAR